MHTPAHLGAECVVVALVEVACAEQGPHHARQRTDLRLAVRQLVLVQQEGLHTTGRDKAGGSNREGLGTSAMG